MTRSLFWFVLWLISLATILTNFRTIRKQQKTIRIQQQTIRDLTVAKAFPPNESET